MRCAITIKACVTGVRRLGLGVHLSHLPIHCRVPWCGGQLGTIVVQSSLRHFMQQPQSILWHLQYALDNTLRQGTMQCQETCRMAFDTINLLDEDGMQGCNCKCKGTESIPNICRLLEPLWSNTFSLRNQIHNNQLLLVCPNNVSPVGVKLKAQVFTSWGNQQQAEHSMEIAQIRNLHHNQGWIGYIAATV